MTTGQGVDIATLGVVPVHVSVETFVPQAQVFPHAAVVLNDGGSGTVLGSLAAWIPMVIAPLFAVVSRRWWKFEGGVISG